MIDLRQKVFVKWNPTTRTHFENLGYSFTKYNDVFEVVAEDLPIGSGSLVVVNCDYCNETLKIPYFRYMSAT